MSDTTPPLFPPPPPAPPPPARPANRRTAWFVGVGACAGLFLLVLLIGLVAGSGTDDDAGQAETGTSAPTTAEPTSTSTRPPRTTTTVAVAELQAELDAEAAEACTEAFTTGKAPDPSYDDDWAPTGIDEAGLHFIVDLCVQQRIDEAIGAAGPVDVDAIVKDPDAFTGEAFVMVVEITQLDGATGPCSFRGYWDNRAHEYNFEYAGDNAYFNAGDGRRDCPVLDGIDQNDVVRVWTVSQGTLSYATQIGGNTTVPSFRVLRAEIIRKE